MQERNRSGGFRRVALIFVGIFMGAILITPAVAHVTPSLTHLFTHTDQRYYKKATANTRFVNVGEKATNSDSLDGHDSSAFANSTFHNFAFTDECDTAATWNECGFVEIVVPAGESYNVSVWNSATALGTGADISALFCAGRRDVGTELTPSCISPFAVQSAVTILAGKFTAFASSGETTVGPGTWRFSLAFNPTAQVTLDDFGKVVTKILVRDASGPVPASALSIKVVKPVSPR